MVRVREAATAARLGSADVMGSFDGPIGAYVHVPFCERICPFCPYNKVRAEEGLAGRYFSALYREIDWYVAEQEAARREPFTSLYFGGGTPTLYPDDLAKVIARIPVSGDVAVEVLPTHGTPERLEHLADIGVTAVSIGAQSFHDGVLRRLHRPHDAAASRAAIENALGRFACVDVDLIVDVVWRGTTRARSGGCSWTMFAPASPSASTRSRPTVDAIRVHPFRRGPSRPWARARDARTGVRAR